MHFGAHKFSSIYRLHVLDTGFLKLLFIAAGNYVSIEEFLLG